MSFGPFSYNNISIVSPAGSIIGYLGTTDPAGWVIMNGISRSFTSSIESPQGIYTNVYNMGIGTVSGTNYTPPNYLGAFLRGIDGSGNYVGPTSVNTTQNDSFASHSHGVTDPGHSHGVTDPGHNHLMPGGGTNFSGGVGHTTTTDNNGGANNNYVNSNVTGISINSNTTGISVNSTGGTETRPYNYGVNWILKL